MSGILTAFFTVPHVIFHTVAVRPFLQSYILAALALVTYRYVVVLAHLELI